MRRRDFMLATIASSMTGKANAATGPVVLELFTSQSCSSCPPADALLGRLARRPNVIALAWHVDYWNRLGWHDRFSSREATERQTAYARQFGTEVFTPALVIDGARMVVGSDDAAVEHAIQAARSLAVGVTLTRSGQGISVDIAAAPDRLRILRIVYDPERATDVEAGENQGSRLRDYRVVRAVEILGETDGSAQRFATVLPDPTQGQAILAQDLKLRLVGAADFPAIAAASKSA